MNGISRNFSVCVRPLHLFLLAGALLAGRAAQAEAALPPAQSPGGTLVPERSGPGVQTYDLGADPDHPGSHRYGALINSASPAIDWLMPARLGEAPLRWKLPDGREIRWRIDELESLPLQVEPVQTGEAMAARLSAAPATALLRRNGPEGRLLVPLTGGVLRGRWSLPAGMSAALTPGADKPGIAADGLEIRDRAAGALLHVTFAPGTALRLEDLGGGDYRLTATPPSADAPSGPQVIDATISSAATWGGWQCAVTGAGNTASNGSPFTNVFVGEWFHNAGVTSYHCDGYLLWSMNSIPASATVTGAWLRDVHANSLSGGPLTINVRDVDNGRTLTATAGYAYDVNYFNDFSGMFGGRPTYATFTVPAGNPGNTGTNCLALTPGYYCAELGAQAVADINTRIRAQNYFAAGFSSPVVTAANYLTFDTANSQLLVYYTDYAPAKVVISYVGVRNDQERYEIDLYNYGEAVNLNGWKVGIKNYAGFGSTVTLPSYVLAHHSRVRLLTSAGSNSGDTLHVGILGALDNASSYVLLQQPSLANTDFVCTGGTVALPATPGWAGACVGSPGGDFQYDLARNTDADTDGAADWTVTPNTAFLPNPPVPLPGQSGTRRRGDVFINELTVNSTAGDFNWIELANYGPSVDLRGWTVEIWNAQGISGTFKGTYTFPNPNVIGSGWLVWLAEGAYFGAPDVLHRNLGFAIDWDAPTPRGGEIILRDAAGRTRDYVKFGEVLIDHMPADFAWYGGRIPIATSGNYSIYRGSDLSVNGDDTWSSVLNTNYLAMLNPGQQGALRHDQAIGTGSSSPAQSVGYFNYGGGNPFGAGSVIQVQNQIGIEEFAVQGAALVAGSGTLVVKKQGAGALFYQQSVSVSKPGQGLVSTGRINPPLALSPGVYAVMLYVNGSWYDAEITGTMDSTTDPAYPFLTNQRLSFGRVLGYSVESSGTPTAGFGISSGWAAHVELSTIDPAVITSAATLPAGTAGLLYSGFTHTATGGFGAYTWSLAGASALPPGLVMSAAGVVSGTPTTAGYYRFTVQVTDAAGLLRTQLETLVVNPALQVGTSSLPDADTHLAYSAQLVAFGGKPAYSWSLIGGTLPTNLFLTSPGVISGTTTAADGTYSFTVRVIDANGSSDTRTLSIKVQSSALILSGILPAGNPAVYYVACLNGRGGTGTANWALITGTLPPPLTLGPLSGCISGTPTTNGTYNFTVRYTAGAQSITKPFSIIISDAAAPPYWVRRGLTGGNLTQLFFSPSYALDGTVVGTNGTVLYASTTRGRFWKPMRLRLTARRSGNSALPDLFTSVAFAPDFDGRAVTDPARPPAASYRIIVTSDHTGAWYSDDFDATPWTVMASGLSAEDGAFAFGADAQFSPAFNSDNTVYIRSFEPVTKSHMLYRGIVNTGAKTAVWAPLNLNQPDFRGGLQFSPTFAADQTVYGQDAAYTRLYRSTDGGGHWVVAHDFTASPVPAGNRPALSPNHATDNTLALVGSGGAVLISDDRGVTFNHRDTLGNSSTVRIPSDYNPATHPVIYMGSGNTLYVSRDGGASYTPTGQGGVGSNDLNLYSEFQLSPDFAADGTVIAQGTSDVGLYRSEDGGANWGPSDGGLYIQEIKTLVYGGQYSISGRAYLGTKHSAYFTANRGRTWVKSNLGNVDVRALRVNPQDDTNVFAFICENEEECYIAESVDGGRNYNYVSNGGNPLGDVISRPQAFQISPDFFNDQIMAYANDNPDYYQQHLMASPDSGQSFVEREPDPVGDDSAFYQAFAISPAFASDTFACFNFQYGPYQQSGCDSDFNASASGYMSLFSVPAPVGNSVPVFTPQFNYITGVNGQLSHTFFMNCGKTTNAGASFANIPSSGPGCSPYGELSITPNYAASLILFSQVSQPDANNPVVGLYRSLNAGASFSRLAPSGDVGDYAGEFDVINQIAVSPFYASDSEVMVATNAGLYISHDDGDTWELASGVDPITPLITAVATDPNRKKSIFLGNGYGEVFRSLDDGLTAQPIQTGLNCLPVNALFAVDGGSSTTVLLAGCPTGIWRTTFNAAGTWSGSWSQPVGAGNNIRGFSDSPGLVYAARTNGFSYYSTTGSASAGQSWLAMSPAVADASAISFSNLSGPTSLTQSGKTTQSAALATPAMPATPVTASLWSASGASGAFYSINGGGNWLPAPGGGDYALPAITGWTNVAALGINAATGGREVLVGNAAQGAFLTHDGGATWRNVSGSGSGIEATSKNVSSIISTLTATSTLDLLIGINGNANGGVYLSGDGGEHWTQVNQGFDPSSLNISTLAKTSCTGCPTQYYSGTYGSGLYTRTIPVLAAPAFSATPGAALSCWGSTGCACVAGAGSGPEQGGQAFKLCGSNFLSLATVEFDGVAATGCTTVNASTITCTGTPPHLPANVTVRVRNTDTRTGYLPGGYNYTAGAPRATGLTVAKGVGPGSNNAILNWTCAGCGSPPARVYRSQNANFTLNVETYTGGVGTYTNTNALAAGSNSTYFWNVE